ncbi:MAG: hypothetical protein HY305_06275 [Sphingobacteriales bacterium]|nr:hypothetical protein [Sphingobacteriales bacterium]
MTRVDNQDGEVYYKGEFKNGLQHGKGIRVSGTEYYIGSFKKGFKNGYGASYATIKLSGKYKYAPDSTGAVCYQNHEDENTFKSVTVYEDGATKQFSKYTGEFRKDFFYRQVVKDKWIISNVNALTMARRNRFVSL